MVAEIVHTQLRPRNYTDIYDRHFSLGSHVEERDRKAIARTTSGLIKLLHPDGSCSKAEVEEYLRFAIEVRRCVKEQLKRMGGIEYSRVNLSYIDKPTGQETFVSCKELGSSQIIPEGPLAQGDLFTVGFDPSEGRYALYRIQVNAIPGGGRFNVVGTTGKGIKESARMAYDYLKANGKKIGLDRDTSAYDLNIQEREGPKNGQRPDRRWGRSRGPEGRCAGGTARGEAGRAAGVAHVPSGGWLTCSTSGRLSRKTCPGACLCWPRPGSFASA
jgi:ATP-dependent Lon protease